MVIWRLVTLPVGTCRPLGYTSSGSADRSTVTHPVEVRNFIWSLVTLSVDVLTSLGSRRNNPHMPLGDSRCGHADLLMALGDLRSGRADLHMELGDLRS